MNRRRFPVTSRPRAVANFRAVVGRDSRKLGSRKPPARPSKLPCAPDPDRRRRMRAGSGAIRGDEVGGEWVLPRARWPRTGCRGPARAGRRARGAVPGPEDLVPAAVEPPRDDGLRGHLRLVDRRYRLRMRNRAWSCTSRTGACSPPAGGPCSAARWLPSWMQLRARRLEEAAAREFGGAVRGLQRDTDERERRPDIDDGAAVARAHPGQRGHRSPHLTEERHLHRALEIRGFTPLKFRSYAAAAAQARA